LKIERKDILFIVGVSLVYCSLSAGFSLVSTILPDKTVLPNPLEHAGFSISLKEIIGHFIFGAVAGIVTLRLKYIILGGLLAVLIDSDHLVGLLHMEGIPKMSHSITFSILSMIFVMLVFHKKDYRLGAIVATTVLTHISYDIFDGGYKFPFLTPFFNKTIQFASIDWIFFEIAAIVIVGIISLIVTRKESSPKNIPNQ
jgi:hypothetical protein